MKLLSLIPSIFAILIGVATASSLCTTIHVIVGGQKYGIHNTSAQELARNSPDSHLTHMLKDYKCGDDPIFIDRNPYVFPHVMKLMRYGKILPGNDMLEAYNHFPSLLTDLIRDLNFYYNNEVTILDDDEVIAALKKENLQLLDQLKALEKEKDEWEALLVSKLNRIEARLSADIMEACSYC